MTRKTTESFNLEYSPLCKQFFTCYFFICRCNIAVILSLIEVDGPFEFLPTRLNDFIFGVIMISELRKKIPL